jgi:hypothetical protein
MGTEDDANDVVMTVRLPREVVDAAEAKAGELGVTLGDLIDAGLRRELGMKPNPKLQFLLDVAERLRADVPNRKSFRSDVTLQVFHAIRDDASLRSSYDQLISGPDGTINDRAKEDIHRKVGKLVPRVLGAKVMGRSLPLDPAVHLIKTHALLAPGD